MAAAAQWLLYAFKTARHYAGVRYVAGTIRSSVRGSAAQGARRCQYGGSGIVAAEVEVRCSRVVGSRLWRGRRRLKRMGVV